MWVFRQPERRPIWIIVAASRLFRLGMSISPKARHVSMVRKPAGKRESS
jgi:hypothetical protein